jgi:hypothetical protein
MHVPDVRIVETAAETTARDASPLRPENDSIDERPQDEIRRTGTCQDVREAPASATPKNLYAEAASIFLIALSARRRI